LGICLVWSKRTNLFLNLLWSILPIILWYPTLVLTTLFQGFTDQKFDIYIEENYTGDIAIVSKMKCGQPIQKKNGREQLFIPSNGILMYKGKISYGIVNHRYYSKLKNDSLYTIPQRSQNGDFYNWADNKPPSDLKVAWGTGMRTRGSFLLTPNFEYTVMTMQIGSMDSLEEYNKSDIHNHFEETTDSIVNNCVKKLHTTSATHQQGQLHNK